MPHSRGDAFMRKQREILKHHTEVAFVRWNCRQIASGKRNRAGVRQRQTGNCAQQRRLATSGRPQQTDNLPCGNGGIDAAQRNDRQGFRQRIDVQECIHG